MAFKTLIRKLIIFSILVFLGSCNYTKGLSRALEERPPHLEYLHEPATVSEKSGSNIFVRTQVEQSMAAGEYRGRKAYFIPLLFYWHFYSKRMMHLFPQQLENPADETLNKNIAEDIERHTSFSVVEDSTKADYTLTVTADSIGAFCLPKIKTNLFVVPLATVAPVIVFFWNTKYSYAGGLSYSQLNYQLYNKNDELILSESTEAEEKVLFFTEQALYAIPETYPIMMHGTLVSALASNLKNNVKDIVRDLNQVGLNQKQSPRDTDERWGSAK